MADDGGVTADMMSNLLHSLNQATSNPHDESSSGAPPLTQMKHQVYTNPPTPSVEVQSTLTLSSTKNGGVGLKTASLVTDCPAKNFKEGHQVRAGAEEIEHTEEITEEHQVQAGAKAIQERHQVQAGGKEKDHFVVDIRSAEHEDNQKRLGKPAHNILLAVLAYVMYYLSALSGVSCSQCMRRCFLQFLYSRDHRLPFLNSCFQEIGKTWVACLGALTSAIYMLECSAGLLEVTVYQNHKLSLLVVIGALIIGACRTYGWRGAASCSMLANLCMLLVCMNLCCPSPMAAAGPSTPMAAEGLSTPMPAAGPSTPMPAVGPSTPMAAAGPSSAPMAAARSSPILLHFKCALGKLQQKKSIKCKRAELQQKVYQCQRDYSELQEKHADLEKDYSDLQIQADNHIHEMLQREPVGNPQNGNFNKNLGKWMRRAWSCKKQRDVSGRVKNKLRTKLTDCQAKKRECGQQNNEVKNELSACKGEKTRLDSQLSACNGVKSSCETQKTKLEGELSACNGVKWSCMTEKTGLEGQLSECRDKEKACGERTIEFEKELAQCKEGHASQQTVEAWTQYATEKYHSVRKTPVGYAATQLASITATCHLSGYAALAVALNPTGVGIGAIGSMLTGLVAPMLLDEVIATNKDTPDGSQSPDGQPRREGGQAATNS